MIDAGYKAMSRPETQHLAVADEKLGIERPT